MLIRGEGEGEEEWGGKVRGMEEVRLRIPVLLFVMDMYADLDSYYRTGGLSTSRAFGRRRRRLDWRGERDIRGMERARWW